MGLLERIRAERDRIVANPAVSQAVLVAQEIQRKTKQEWKDQRKAQVLANKQEADQKAALTAELKNLLKVAGARELLTEARKAWGVGKVDKRPSQILDVASFFTAFSHDRHQSPDLTAFPQLPAILLALRHRFRDTESVPCDDELDYVFRGAGFNEVRGSHLLEHEVALYVIAGIEKTGLPFVASLAALQRSDSFLGRAYRSGDRRYHLKRDRDYSQCLSHGQPETIFPDNPGRSREILEDQLFKRCTNMPNPLDLVEEARMRVLYDPNLPTYARNTISSVWYRRIPLWALDGLVELNARMHS